MARPQARVEGCADRTFYGASRTRYGDGERRADHCGERDEAQVVREEGGGQVVAGEILTSLAAPPLWGRACMSAAVLFLPF